MHPRRSRVTEIAYGDCRRCGALFVRRSHQLGDYCSQRCSMKARKRMRRHLARTGVGGECFTLRDIAERDGWRCHLCGGSVPDREWGARPNDPTIDHLVPVSDGGEHTRVNVALAHYRCNYTRSNTGPAQLLLVG